MISLTIILFKLKIVKADEKKFKNYSINILLFIINSV